VRDRFNERWRRTQDDLRKHHPRSQKLPRVSTPAGLLARALNLNVEETASGATSTGFVFGSEVRIDVWPGRGGADEAWIRLRGRALPPGLAIAREGGLRTVASVFGREDVRTGDETFDAAVVVRGDRAEAVAVLDASSRAHILKLLAYDFVLESGTATLSATLHKGGRVKQIAADVRLAAHLLKRMSFEQRTVSERLLDLMRHDPNGTVRVRAFELLETVAIHALERAADQLDRYPREIRWRLLLRKMPRSAEALREALEDPTAPLSTKALAFEELGRSRPFEELVHFAEASIELDAAAELILGVSADSAALAALGERGLLLLLERGSVEQRLAAIEGLAARGSRSAIEALLPHAGGFFVRPRIKDAARRAIAAIERREALDRGRLSLAPAAGELSVTRDEGGLALTDDAQT
jgi:hypothetical protein